MDTRLIVSALATEEELQQLWKAREAATGGLDDGERAPFGGLGLGSGDGGSSMTASAPPSSGPRSPVPA